MSAIATWKFDVRLTRAFLVIQKPHQSMSDRTSIMMTRQKAFILLPEQRYDLLHGLIHQHDADMNDYRDSAE